METQFRAQSEPARQDHVEVRWREEPLWTVVGWCIAEKAEPWPKWRQDSPGYDYDCTLTGDLEERPEAKCARLERVVRLLGARVWPAAAVKAISEAALRDQQAGQDGGSDDE